MRYFNLFLLRFQEIFARRSRSFLLFLKALLNPLFLLFFWKGVGRSELFFTQSFIVSYYLFSLFAYTLLMSDIEEEVSTNDIDNGGLNQYLLKPFPYYWMKFLEELPYRLLQGAFGLSVFIFLSYIFNTLSTIKITPLTFLLTFIIFMLAYVLAFTFKMLMGIVAFWIEDTQAMYHVVDAALLVFTGSVIPLQFMPENLRYISELLPFSYMVYFPVMAGLGLLPMLHLLQVIGIQIIWLGIFSALYVVYWRKGIRKFSAAGI